MRLQRWWDKPWVRRLALALALLGLAGTWRAWLPALLGLAPVLREYADPLQGASVLVDWALRALAVVIPLLWPRRGPQPESKLLWWTTADKVIAHRSDRGQTPWQPRPPASRFFLNDHPRFVFRDVAGAGKTREALELLRNKDGNPVRGLVAPNWGPRFDAASRDDLSAALDRLPLSPGPVALWLDDLHERTRAECRERVAELIALLGERVGEGNLFVVGTMRDDLPSEPWDSCFRQHGVQVLTLTALADDAWLRLAEEMAQREGGWRWTGRRAPCWRPGRIAARS